MISTCRACHSPTPPPPGESCLSLPLRRKSDDLENRTPPHNGRRYRQLSVPRGARLHEADEIETYVITALHYPEPDLQAY
ncbi:hypothetical protein E2C01_031906 [Portunus trituberculatus]|uniref:Uncharacterized protein n=1 Tax=Portunus trituberculatus TaxID=210409 RepID=A0A5B7EU13_PORTR|nr:hypothetical protein [Portunus trituberculatus]